MLPSKQRPNKGEKQMTRKQRQSNYDKNEPKQEVMSLFFVGDKMEDEAYQKKLEAMLFTSHRN